MAVSARLSPLEQALLDALCLGETQTDVIREGIRLVWELRGPANLVAQGWLKPEKADRLRELIKGYDGDDPAWFKTLQDSLDAELVLAGQFSRDVVRAATAGHEAHSADGGETE